MTLFNLKTKEKKTRVKHVMLPEEEEEMKLRDSEIAKTVGRKIKLFRQLKGLSQSDIASHLGITFQQFQKYESGKNRIPVARLMKLADIFGVKMAIFFENAVNVMFEGIGGEGKVNRLQEDYTPIEFSSNSSNRKSLEQSTSVNIPNMSFENEDDSQILVKYFKAIHDVSIRKNILTLVKSLAEEN